MVDGFNTYESQAEFALSSTPGNSHYEVDEKHPDASEQGPSALSLAALVTGAGEIVMCLPRGDRRESQRQRDVVKTGVGEVILIHVDQIGRAHV